MNASWLRLELSERAQRYAHARDLPYCQSYGQTPTVCFPCHDDRSQHGNFLPATYKAILKKPEWRRRLQKVHTLGRKSFPRSEHGNWRELDACTSSDALLMNIFCYPGVLRRIQLLTTLGTEPDVHPCFGVKASVPLSNDKFDRTEVDMQLGDVLFEAKLTESDFQSAEKRVLLAYRDFADVFECEELPQTESHYLSYQLLRYVLAASATDCSCCVLLDARRPDLIEAWYTVIKCVKGAELRAACKVLTWQELAEVLPTRLQVFLAEKYGISGKAGSREALG
jgi:hypothetical protein